MLLAVNAPRKQGRGFEGVLRPKCVALTTFQLLELALLETDFPVLASFALHQPWLAARQATFRVRVEGSVG